MITPGRSDWQDDAAEGSKGVGAENGRGVEQFMVDALERCDQGLRHGEAANHKDRGEQQAGEGERQTVAERGLPESPERAMRALHRDQDVEPEHGRRQDERQSDDRLDEKFTAPLGICQPIREGQSDGEENRRDCQAANRIVRSSDCIVKSAAASRGELHDRRHAVAIHGCGAAFELAAGTVNPYLTSVARPGSLFTNSRNARAASLSLAFFSIATPCSSGGWESAGISQRWPSFIAGDMARESAMMPPCALPDCTNWAACEMFSPKTSFA